MLSLSSCHPYFLSRDTSQIFKAQINGPTGEIPLVECVNKSPNMGNFSCCVREAVESSIFEEVAGNGGNGNLGSLYPMYLIRVSDFLEMNGIPEPHHVLKRRGLLHIWQTLG